MGKMIAFAVGDCMFLYGNMGHIADVPKIIYVKYEQLRIYLWESARIVFEL